MGREQDAAALLDLVSDLARLLRAQAAANTTAEPMTETERLVMRIVDLHPGSTAASIAARGRIKPPNVSAALRSLESRRFVERRKEGRTVLVHPTPTAEANLDRIRADRSALVADLRLIDGLSDERIADARAVLAAIEANLTRRA